MKTIDSKLSSWSDYLEVQSSDLFEKARLWGTFHRDYDSRGFNKYVLSVREYRGGRALVGERTAAREVLMFCLADYLDLARSPAVKEAAIRAVGEQGASVSAVPVIAGATDLHKEFERNLAQFVGAEDSVVFPTGQAANTATIAALCGARDYIILDKQVHASVLEGVKLSGAKWRTFRHSNPEHLESILKGIREKGHRWGVLVIVEGVYGLDGDIPPLRDIAAVTTRFGARLFVDDAHGTGVLGSGGAGTHAHFGLNCPDILMGSLSKSFGSVGGWIAATREVTTYLRYFSGTLAFSVGIAPSAVAAAGEALRMIGSDSGLNQRLIANAHYLRQRLLDIGVENASLSASALMSARIDSEPVLREVLKDLFDQGIWVEGLQFPATMRGQERIRLRARASHTSDDIDRAVDIVESVLRKHAVLKPTLSIVSVPVGLERGEAIVSLAIKEADVKGLRLPWTSGDYYRRIVCKAAFWANALGERSKWFTGSSAPLSACLMASVLPAALPNGSVTTTGFIGHAHWLPEHLGELDALVGEAVEWLSDRGAQRIVGPVQVPMQVLGAGITVDYAPDQPFLEPMTDPKLAKVLIERRFEPCHVNPYRLRRIDETHNTATLPADCGLTLRMLRRESLVSEIAAIAEAFNQGISTRPLCTMLESQVLIGVASELRELVIPEFWWLIGNEEGSIVAFAGGFPELGRAFSAIGGTGDISDNEYLREAIDGTRRGFLAWASVRADYAGRGLVEVACRKVLSEMRRRGYNEVWTSWELVDGDQIPLDGVPVEREIGFQIFERSGLGFRTGAP